MEISKSDVLFLYSVLFRTVVSDHVNLGDKEDHAADLLSRFEEYLTNSSETGESVTETEQTFDETVIEADDVIAPSALCELPELNVKSPTGDYVTLEFEENDDGVVEAKFDDGNVIMEALAVKVLTDEDNVEIQIHSSDEWQIFEVKKLPKAWKTKFQSGLIYAIFNEEEE